MAKLDRYARAHAKPDPNPWAFDAGNAWEVPDAVWDAPEWNEPQPLNTWDEREPE